MIKTIGRRINTGFNMLEQWRYANVATLLFLSMFFVLLVVPVVTALLIAYVVGHITEYREDKREGIETVRGV